MQNKDNPLHLRPHDPYFDDIYGVPHGTIPQQENPEQVAFETLCFEVFIKNEAGRELYRRLKKKYIDNQLFNPMLDNAQQLAMYYEGFKEALRGLYAFAERHQELLKQGKRQ